MKNNWDKYEVHVLETLTRLEKTQNELFQFVRDHKEKEEARIDELTAKVQKVENDSKWYVKISSFVWGIIVTGGSLWIGSE